MKPAKGQLFSGREDGIEAVALGQNEDVYVAGYSKSTNTPTVPGGFQPTHAPTVWEDAFVARLNSTGTQLLAFTFFGGNGIEHAYDLHVDPSGVVSIGGYVEGGPMPTTPGAFQVTSGYADLFAARFSPSLSRLFYATRLGGPSLEFRLAGFAVDPTGNGVLGGSSVGGFPVTPGAALPNYAGGQTDGTVSVLDFLPRGAQRYGVSTPACSGPIPIHVTAMPAAGASNFGFYCTAAPPLASGWLLIGRSGAPVPIQVLGAKLWIDPSRGLSRLPVTANALGYVERPVTIPTSAQGEHFVAQFVFPGLTHCGAGWGIAASDALKITVQ
ncbi:MAG: hypothetical protein HZA53_10025 [Planctomycetes bacterium]|nr:hypothetical protein [Planctomycetota bacterium]